ncbi:spermidine synthase [Novosphingobium sp. KCTC 2891]|uniref:spermidine synthase n=1 Tax=Novosphingobium sp. KCTC 2891 TaxID=2989730 RepID=UPI002221F5A3|nr:spermidine synthase [Novosphingobium sp. KCTC 2891]MCW1381293.1 spermidine synthase [Novosphingobium sp. KCTC 2891]
MIKRELLGTAQVPGGVELKLYQHDRDFMIVLGHNELMSSRMSGSEVALAVETCARLDNKASARLLVGGYGMGFTLRAALATLGPKAQVVVAELVPEVIDWARGPMADLAAGCLDDPRVTVRMGDVADAIGNAKAEMPGGYDAILLDVDNGPDGLVRRDNNRIYTSRGLRAAREALRPGGVLAVWSAAPDPAFTRRLQEAFTVEEITVRARANGKGPRHVIWFAR